MKRSLLLSIVLLTIVTACDRKHNSSANENSEYTEQQELLLDEGWTKSEPISNELDERYGYTPRYGLQDNYFDITIGKGVSVLVKIIDNNSGKCIRCVYVQENTTTTVNQIPQGVYNLKLAYGNDWMEYNDGENIKGRFTRNCTYERSVEAYNFGKKNTSDFVNYHLMINVSEEIIEHNFETTQISEADFYND